MSLQGKFPEKAKKWHPTRNNNLLLLNFTPFSHKKVWWLCPKKCEYGCLHEYERKISDEIKCKECPFCSESSNKLCCIHSSFGFKYVNITKEWHPTKNLNLKPTDFTPSSSKVVWWLCPKTCEYGCLHEYKQTIYNKKNGSGCPYCSSNSNQKLCFHQTLEFLFPAIAKQWHPTKNWKLKPSNVSIKSHIKVWWLCDKIIKCGCVHEYQQAIYTKTNNIGCPYCSKNTEKVCLHQSFKYIYPKLALEWHPSKNNNFSPEQFSPHSNKKFWWICLEDKSHEWFTSINNRKYRGCPYCRNKTESDLYKWLKLNFPQLEIQRQSTFNWCRNLETKRLGKFDFLIVEYNLLIELDGKQHFEQISNWTSQLETQDRDIFKMKTSLNNNYSMIRLLQEDVRYNKNNWENKLKNKIKLYKKPKHIFICENNEYEIYKNKLKK